MIDLNKHMINCIGNHKEIEPGKYQGFLTGNNVSIYKNNKLLKTVKTDNYNLKVDGNGNNNNLFVGVIVNPDNSVKFSIIT